ncbi:angiopoietin-related protein 1 [Elysia marginata]|uniref:Angiopoietin-related protein 1 n=1 Tax=Elysia marginata TaxID=1093978 RepID=A0AAV4H766_9GAST|nr:angiopoietin-related protein 1 [Elysia marginata]
MKSFEPALGGDYCGKIICTHPGGGFENVALLDVSEIGVEYYSEEKGRGVELYYVYKDGDGWVSEVNNLETEEQQYLGDFEFSQNDDELSVRAMVKNPLYCRNHARYSCYMGYSDGGSNVYVDTRSLDADKPVVDVGLPPIGGGAGSVDDEEPSVQMAVISIMTTMADEVEKLHQIVDASADILTKEMDSVRDQIQNDGDGFVVELNTGLGEINTNVEQLKAEIGNEVTSAYNAISIDVGLSTQTLEEKLQTLEADLATELENQRLGLDQRITDLNDSVSSHLKQSESIIGEDIDGLKQSVQNGLSALSLDVESSAATTSVLFTTASSDLQQKLSDTESEAKRALESVGSLAGLDIEFLEKSFTDKIGDLRKELNSSLSATKEKLDKNSETYTNEFDQETSTLQDKTSTASGNLKTSVDDISKQLVAELNTKKTKVTERLQTVDASISTQTLELSTQIANQENDLQKEMNASSTRASNALAGARDSISETSTTLRTTLISTIGGVSDRLGTENENLKSKISQTTSFADEALAGLSLEVSATLTSLEDKISNKINAVQSEFTKDIDTLEQEQVVSSGLQMDKTKDELTNVETKLMEDIEALNNNVNDTITTLSTDAGNALASMDTDMEISINNVGRQVDSINEDITQAINALAQNSQDNLRNAFSSLETSVGALNTATSQVIERVAQSTSDVLGDFGLALNVSFAGLQEDSQAKFNEMQQNMATSLASLKKQSEDIGTHVQSLGGEISTEQTKITALLTKFGELTNQVSGITNQVNQFQTGLVTYKDKASDLFTSTNTELTVKGQATLGLMSGVANKIGQLKTMIESAQSTFHSNVVELGNRVENVGKRVGVFVNSNIDDILGHMDNQTRRITSYLQPKQCSRNMNYASVSNTQYVVISPNDESNIEFDILCDTATDGGGWIVIQRRTQNDIVFYRNWQFYKEGFGNMDTDFYMGNDRIHELTKNRNYELRITMEKDEHEYYASYSTFYIDGEDAKYKLHVGGYSGTAGDAMAYHNGSPFSTMDRDNDRVRRLNCAMHQEGAWWYKECRHSNLNGVWDRTMDWSQPPIRGVVASTEMKIRLKA